MNGRQQVDDLMMLCKALHFFFQVAGKTTRTTTATTTLRLISLVISVAYVMTITLIDRLLPTQEKC